MEKTSRSAKEFHRTLKKVYNIDYELELYTALISEFYNLGVDELTVEAIIIELYNLQDQHQFGRGDIVNIIDEMWNGKTHPNAGVDGVKILLTKHFDKLRALEIVKELKTIYYSFDKNKSYHFNLSDTRYVTMNTSAREVGVTDVKYDRKGNDNSNYTKVLACCPKKIISHDNPISTAGRKFTIEWITKNGGFFITDEMIIPEIETYLENHGYVLSPKTVKGVVACIIQMSIDNDLIEQRNQIETDGFYYDKESKSLISVGYDIKPVDIGEVANSLKLIGELVEFFHGSEGKLATTLKHGLISPFGFAKKQMNLPLENLIPYLHHGGRAESGKTTIARIALYFYGKPDSETNDKGGSECDTVPRFGNQVSKSTFGMIINETEILFKKKSIKETIKTAVERTNARARYNKGAFEDILALSTLQCTSNDTLPIEEGLNRRFVQLYYSFNDKKTNDEKDKFVEYFRLTSTDCRFLELQALGNWVANEIQSDISLLELPWKELSNSLILRAYADCGMTCPEWLLGFEEVTPEDLDEEQSEDIRGFFIEEINKQMNKIQYTSYDDGTGQNRFTDDIKTSDEFYDDLFNVINNYKIPYMQLKQFKDGKYYVCFLNNLKRALSNEGYDCLNIKSLAEMLNWEYGQIWLHGKNKRVMYVEFNTFLEYLYGE